MFILLIVNIVTNDICSISINNKTNTENFNNNFNLILNNIKSNEFSEKIKNILNNNKIIEEKTINFLKDDLFIIGDSDINKYLDNYINIYLFDHLNYLKNIINGNFDNNKKYILTFLKEKHSNLNKLGLDNSKFNTYFFKQIKEIEDMNLHNFNEKINLLKQNTIDFKIIIKYDLLMFKQNLLIKINKSKLKYLNLLKKYKTLISTLINKKVIEYSKCSYNTIKNLKFDFENIIKIGMFDIKYFNNFDDDSKLKISPIFSNKNINDDVKEFIFNFYKYFERKLFNIIFKVSGLNLVNNYNTNNSCIDYLSNDITNIIKNFEKDLSENILNLPYLNYKNPISSKIIIDNISNFKKRIEIDTSENINNFVSYIFSKYNVKELNYIKYGLQAILISFICFTIFIFGYLIYLLYILNYNLDSKYKDIMLILFRVLLIILFVILFVLLYIIFDIKKLASVTKLFTTFFNFNLEFKLGSSFYIFLVTYFILVIYLIIPKDLFLCNS